MRMLRPLLAATLLTLVAGAPCVAQDEVLPITSARVTQLLQGLAAERVVWTRIKAMEDSADAARSRVEQSGEDRRAKSQAWEECSNRNEAPMSPDLQQHAMRVTQKMMSLDEAQRTALMRQSEELTKAAEDAARRGDAQAAQMTQAAMRKMVAQVTGIPEAELKVGDDKMMAWSMANDARVTKACGPRPEPSQEHEAGAPRSPDPGESAMIDAIDQLQTKAGVDGVKASGLTQRQYAILRERVVAWLAAQDDASSLGAYKFTDAERAALAARRADLSRYSEILTRTPSWNFD